MKKWILLLLFVLINMNLCLFAQQRAERRRAEFEEFKEKRIAFISKAMELNAEEAKVFWPLYNELQEKKFELNQELRKTLYEFTGNERNRKTHTESEYKEIVNLCAQFKIKEAKFDEEYISKFAKVISYEKIFRYQQAELQFARQMLEQRRER
jgi:hypothetical protein